MNFHIPNVFWIISHIYNNIFWTINHIKYIKYKSYFYIIRKIYFLLKLKIDFSFIQYIALSHFTSPPDPLLLGFLLIKEKVSKENSQTGQDKL